MPDQTMTCPRKIRAFGAWVPTEPGEDFWRTTDSGERTCSFCGSLHPDDFMALCAMAAEDTAPVEIQTHNIRTEVWITRPSDDKPGFTKVVFLPYHAPHPDAITAENHALFALALKKSNERVGARWLAAMAADPDMR